MTGRRFPASFVVKAVAFLMLCAVIAVGAQAALGRLSWGDVVAFPHRVWMFVFQPDVIAPERHNWGGLASEYHLTLYRYVSSDPMTTDGASMTFRLPRHLVMTTMVSGSGPVPYAPILFDYDTSKPLKCGRDCKRIISATLYAPTTFASQVSLTSKVAGAPPIPPEGLMRRFMGDTIYAVGDSYCGFSLYETDDQRTEGLSYPLNKARILDRPAADGAPARSIECKADFRSGTCWMVEPYELDARLEVYFPSELVCEADEVMRRTRKLFDDAIVARSGPVPGWGATNR